MVLRMIRKGASCTVILVLILVLVCYCEGKDRRDKIASSLSWKLLKAKGHKTRIGQDKQLRQTAIRPVDSALSQSGTGNWGNSDLMKTITTKLSEFVSGINWDNIIRETRTISARALGKDKIPGLGQWVKAYKRDPIEYQCIRKVACETLAESQLIAKSMKSPMTGVVLHAIGSILGRGNEIQSVVKDTIGNPEKCHDIAPWGFCDEDVDDELQKADPSDN